MRGQGKGGAGKGGQGKGCNKAKGGLKPPRLQSNSPRTGAISSAVERFVHIEDVSGSNPLSPTIPFLTGGPCGRPLSFPASDRGLSDSGMWPGARRA